MQQRVKQKKTPAQHKAKFSRFGMPWTKSEDLKLIKVVDASQRTIVDEFPDRTWSAIRARIRRLKINPNGRQGFESIRAAAIRCGFHRCAMERILEGYGVSIFRSFSLKRHGYGKIKLVEADAATEAAERYLNSESVSQVACKLGVSVARLSAAMKRLGIVGSLVNGSLRIDPHEVDALEENVPRLGSNIDRRWQKHAEKVKKIFGHAPIEAFSSMQITNSCIEKVRTGMGLRAPKGMIAASRVSHVLHNNMAAVRKIVFSEADHSLWWCAPEIRVKRSKYKDGFSAHLYISPQIRSWLEGRIKDVNSKAAPPTRTSRQRTSGGSLSRRDEGAG